MVMMLMTLKKLLHPDVMTLMKCITLKYLTKINEAIPYKAALTKMSGSGHLTDTHQSEKF